VESTAVPVPSRAASSEYEEAYSESSPLVSVIIPTWNRIESLTSRAIPSVLAQTYDNV